MTIAVAYLPNEFGKAALDWAVAQAENTGEPIVLINIARIEPRLDPGHARGTHLQALLEQLSDDGVEIEVRQAVGENVADTLLFEAEQAKATTIVLGIRRRSPVGKLLTGSVAQAVLLDASVPVVAVKP